MKKRQLLITARSTRPQLLLPAISTRPSLSDIYIVKRVGRPTQFTPELGDIICSLLAEGISLRTICKSEDMPDRSTVFRWIRKLPEFRDQYARAKVEGADAMAEDLQDISDEALEAVMKFAATPKIAGAIVQTFKLKSDNMKWSMARQAPKKYGDRINVAPAEDAANPYGDLDEETLRQIARGKA